MPVRTSLIASLLLLAATSFVSAEDAPVTPPQEPVWTDFVSPERGFAVSFPGTPKMSNTPVHGQNPFVEYDFSVAVGDDTAYTVSVFEYPAGKAKNPPDTDSYVKWMQSYAKGNEAKLRKKGAPVTVGPRDGYEAIADDSKTKSTHLIDIIPGGPDRIYMLASIGPKNHATSDNAKRFRDSFRVIGDQPVSSATTP